MDVNEEKTLDLSHHQLQKWDIKKAVQILREEKRMKKISYSAVTQVYLNDNQLTFLPNDFFVAFPSLRWLDLRNNKLENLFEIDPLIHSKVQTIKKNIKGKDHRSQDDVSLLAKPTIAHGLTHLYLSSNCFNNISYNFFTYFPNLQWLDLRNNKLTYVCKYDFKDNNTSFSSSQNLDNLSQEKNFLIKMHLHNICETITTDEDEEDDDEVDLNDNQDNDSKKDIGDNKNVARTNQKRHRKNYESFKTKGSISSQMDSQESPFISKSLRTILLQDNLLTNYPRVLSSKQLFPSLRVIQIHGNPIKDHDDDQSIENKEMPSRDMTLKTKADNLPNSSHKFLGQLCTPKRNSNPSRNSGTSCSNADSGVASQEEDEIESSSKDLETSDVDNKKEKQPYDNQYQIIDTNNEPMTSKETKRNNRHTSSRRKAAANIRVKVTKNSTKNDLNKKRGNEGSTKENAVTKQATHGKKDVGKEEEFPVFDDLEHFTIQKKECQKISSSKWGKIRIAILKNEEGYKMLTQSTMKKSNTSASNKRNGKGTQDKRSGKDSIRSNDYSDQEDNKTKQPLSNKAFNARSTYIQKSKTFPGIKCHYNYLSSNEIPLLILQGYNSDSKSYQKVENKSETNKQQDKDNPFYSKYLAHECLGPTTSQVQIATEKQRERKKKQRRLQIIEHKLQRVKDKNLLKNWRNMYRRRSHDIVRKSSTQSSGPVLPGNSVANTAPFGMDRDRRTKSRAAVAFDSKQETQLDSAYDNLVAEMDRVLNRRSYLSYHDDHNFPSAISKPYLNSRIGSDTTTKNNPNLRREIYSISMEAAASTTEMGRCIGEINKAKAGLYNTYHSKHGL